MGPLMVAEVVGAAKGLPVGVEMGRQVEEAAPPAEAQWYGEGQMR